MTGSRRTFALILALYIVLNIKIYPIAVRCFHISPRHPSRSISNTSVNVKCLVLWPCGSASAFDAGDRRFKTQPRHLAPIFLAAVRSLRGACIVYKLVFQVNCVRLSCFYKEWFIIYLFKQFITAWLHPDITPEIMCRHFLHHHLTLSKPILHPGPFPSKFKLERISPMLKKPGLPKSDLANFRPTSNLNTIGKILQRLALSRFFLTFQISQVFSVTVCLLQISFYWDCLALTIKWNHGSQTPSICWWHSAS